MLHSMKVKQDDEIPKMGKNQVTTFVSDTLNVLRNHKEKKKLINN